MSIGPAGNAPSPRAAFRLRESNDLDGLQRRSLPFSTVLAQSLAGAMPAAMALSTPFVLSRVVGPGAWLSVVIAGSVMWLVNLSVCQFSSRVSTSGSLFSFAAQGLGRFGALAVAVAMFLGYGSLAGWGLAQSAHYASRMSHPVGSEESFGQGGFMVVIVVLAGVCLAVMTLGVRIAGRLTLGVEVLTLVLLACLLGAAALDRGVSFDALGLSGAEPERVLRGTLAMLGIFFCFESAASLGTETAKPFKYVPRATSLALGLMVGLSLLAVLIATPAAGPLDQGQGSAAFWFPDGGSHDSLTWLFYLVRLLCNLGCVLAVWASLSRLVFTCARAGVLPARLGRTHPSLRTPVAALVLTGAFVLGPALVLTTFSADIRAIEHFLLDASDLAFLVMYALTCLAVTPFLRRIGEALPSALLIARIALVAVVLAMLATIWFESRDGEYATLGTLVLIGAGAGGWGWWAGRAPNAGEADLRVHDETIAADVYVPAGGVSS